MDEYALQSQERALAAIASGFLGRQIQPVIVPSGRSQVEFAIDESPRAGLTLEKLASLKPAFKADGKVTAGNSSGVTDGAAAMVVGSLDRMRACGVSPVAKIMTTNAETGEALLAGMGELHLEITVYRIEEEQNIKVKVSPPIVVYREGIEGSNRGNAFEGKSPNPQPLLL